MCLYGLKLRNLLPRYLTVKTVTTVKIRIFTCKVCDICQSFCINYKENNTHHPFITAPVPVIKHEAARLSSLITVTSSVINASFVFFYIMYDSHSFYSSMFSFMLSFWYVLCIFVKKMQLLLLLFTTK